MTGFTWVDGPFGGTPQTAANLNAAMGVSDAAVATAVQAGPLTQAQLSATYVQVTNGVTAEFDSLGGIHLYRNGVEL